MMISFIFFMTSCTVFLKQIHDDYIPTNFAGLINYFVFKYCIKLYTTVKKWKYNFFLEWKRLGL